MCVCVWEDLHWKRWMCHTSLHNHHISSMSNIFRCSQYRLIVGIPYGLCIINKLTVDVMWCRDENGLNASHLSNRIECRVNTHSRHESWPATTLVRVFIFDYCYVVSEFSDRFDDFSENLCSAFCLINFN